MNWGVLTDPGAYAYRLQEDTLDEFYPLLIPVPFASETAQKDMERKQKGKGKLCGSQDEALE